VVRFEHLDTVARKIWVGYPGAVATVAVTSLFVALMKSQLDVPNTQLLYLIAVIVAAVAFGSGPAILAALLSVFTFDAFFSEIEPVLFEFASDDWTSLMVFLITALVTGQLAARQRKKTEEAREREREASLLYDVVRLMSEYDLHETLQIIAERLRSELGLSAILAEISESGEQVVTAELGDRAALDMARSADRTAMGVLAESQAPSPTGRSLPGMWIPVVLQPAQVLSRKLIQDWIPSVPIPAPSIRRTVLFKRVPAIPVPIPAFRPFLRKPVNRINVVPVRVHDHPAGVLILVLRPDAQGLTSGDARLLAAVARQLGIGIERQRLQKEATEVEILRRADDAKTALINAVSHDLRTPLASIMTSAGSLRSTDVHWTSRERSEFAEAIEEEAKRLNRIVQNLLDLSRIEGGVLRPDKTPSSVRDSVDAVLERLQSAASSHHIIVDMPDQLPLVPMDPVEIDQVLTNLIENALKYTPLGTTITITAKHAGDRISIEVSDTGPGIAPASLPRVFEAFYRDPEQGKKTGGSGLGLAVVKGLIEAHGGTIKAENKLEGGARFTFTLPLAGAEAAPGR
jgi:two-component system sensor histidine kinase KdpD